MFLVLFWLNLVGWKPKSTLGPASGLKPRNTRLVIQRHPNHQAIKSNSNENNSESNKNLVHVNSLVYFAAYSLGYHVESWEKWKPIRTLRQILMTTLCKNTAQKKMENFKVSIWNLFFRYWCKLNLIKIAENLNVIYIFYIHGLIYTINIHSNLGNCKQME